MSRVISDIAIIEDNRFSTFVHPKDLSGYALLESWQRHFQQHNIKSVIALNDYGYALYREGLVAQEPWDDD